MWLVPTLFNSTDIQSIFINTEQKVLLYSATTMFQNPGRQRSLTSDTQAVSQACASLFPGSVLLKVNCINSVCVPRSEEWPKDDRIWGLGKGGVESSCIHKALQGMAWSRGWEEKGQSWGPGVRRQFSLCYMKLWEGWELKAKPGFYIIVCFLDLWSLNICVCGT